MSTWNDRVADAAEETDALTRQLIDAAPADTPPDRLHEALAFMAINCDVETEDYEVLETVFLARLSDSGMTGER